jgi:dolichyl-phosphate-mannose-protein mannosyltransferase
VLCAGESTQGEGILTTVTLPSIRPTLRTPAAEPQWTAIDTVAVAALSVLAGGLRLVGIAQPRGFVFDEFYASDACLYVFGQDTRCLTTTEISVVHPPLAKWLIGVGIRVFGFSPAAWRLAPLIAGTLTVAVLYLLARRLFGSTVAAAVAAGLFAFDFLHFVMSRAAMLDVFVVFFGLTSFLCLLYDTDRIELDPGLPHNALRRLRRRPWLLGAGIAGGAAVASKWSGAYILAAVAVLALVYAASRWRDSTDRHWRTTLEEVVIVLIALVLVPAAIYVVSYTGRVHGTVIGSPWEDGSWLHAFFARHRVMFEHHTGSLYTHPYTSPPWSWPLIKRPVLFYFRQPGDKYQEILALGNPLVWWPALLALVWATYRMLRRRSLWAPEVVVVAGFAAGYLPWFVITRQEAFLYYFLPAVPFLYLALGGAVAGISAHFARVVAIASLSAASLGLFVFFYPVIVGKPLSYPEWERRILFDQCGVSDTHKKPVTRPMPPPKGWCWV